MRVLSLFAVLLLLPGCGALGGLFGGGSALSAIEVAGRYEFTEYEIDPVAGSVDDRNLLGREVSRDLTILLTEGGEARLERLSGDTVGETLGTGTYTISGRAVAVRFRRVGDAANVLMPRAIEFEGGNGRLRAEVFLEAVDLEAVSSEYSGITRADIRLKLGLREID
ncbi:MAG: hypothetical protein AAF791_08850 [Bacteroidota bacterium]